MLGGLSSITWGFRDWAILENDCCERADKFTPILKPLLDIRYLHMTTSLTNGVNLCRRSLLRTSSLEKGNLHLFVWVQQSGLHDCFLKGSVWTRVPAKSHLIGQTQQSRPVPQAIVYGLRTWRQKWQFLGPGPV